MTDLRCLHCDYDLHGIALEANRIRCPECGEITHLNVLAAELVRRRRNARNMHVDLAAVVGLSFGVVVVTKLWSSVPGTRAVADRLTNLFTHRGLGAFIALSLLLYGMTLPLWWDRPRRERMLFAIGGALILLLVPAPWSAPLLLGWIGLCAVWR